MANTKKRTDRGSFGEKLSPENKTARVEASNMSSHSETDDEPTLKDIFQLLTEVQGTTTALLKTTFQLTTDVAELKNNVERNRQEVSKLKEELITQNRYVASLEIKLNKTSSYVKEHSEELEELQISVDNLEQYSRKNSLEFCGFPEGIDMSTEQIVCKIAEAVGVPIKEDDIEISHWAKRKRGDKLVLAKFINHKIKSRLYKARTKLKNVSVGDIFLGCAEEATDRPKRIFINENLTPYRKEMMSLAAEKRKNRKIEKVWSLDGKIFIKTSPTGSPRQMFSKDDIKEL